MNFLLIAVCEPYPVGLGSPCGFVAARHSPLLHGLFERAYDPLLFAAAVRGETQKRQADLDENTVFAPVAGDLHLVEAVVEHAVHLDPQNRRVVHPVVEQKVEMRAAADEEALLVGQLDVPSDQIVQPVVSVDADGGKPILLGENSSDEPFGDPFGRRFAFRIGGEPHGGVFRMQHVENRANRTGDKDRIDVVARETDVAQQIADIRPVGDPHPFGLDDDQMLDGP